MDEAVALEFAADVEEAVANVRELKDTAQELAGAAKEAADGTASVGDAATEAAPAVDNLRDQALEAARAMGIYADSAGRFHDESGQFVSGARLEADGLGWIRDNATEAADALRRVKTDTDGVRDSTTGAVPSVDGMRQSVGGLRDKLAEAATELGITRDEMGRLRDASGGVVTATEAEATAMKHLRDRAMEAAWAEKELRSSPKGGIPLPAGGGGIGELSSVFSGGLMSPAGIAVIAQGVQVLLPEVGALATGLVAAGAGAGSFALLAEPAFSKVHTAYTKIQADQKAYDNALTSKQRATAMAHLKQDWAALDPAQAGAVRGVQQLTGEFGKMSHAFEPAAFKVFDAALKDANEFLPVISGFANSAAPAIEGAFSGLGKFLAGGQFKQFTGFLESLSGPSITAIGSGFAGLVPDVMQLMELFSKKDVVNSINIAFRAIGFTLDLVTDATKLAMWNWDTLTRQLHNVASSFDQGRHDVAAWAGDLEHDFDVSRHAVAVFAHDGVHNLDVFRHGAAEAGHDVAHEFDVMRHGIATSADGAIARLKAVGPEILATLLDPAGMAVHEVITHWHDLERGTDVMRHYLASSFDQGRHDVATWADAVPRLAEKAWGLVRHETAAAGDELVRDVESAFGAVRHAMESQFAAGSGDVTRTAASLPGRVAHAVSALPGDLERLGERAMEGLLSGLRSQVGSIEADAEGWAHDIANAIGLPFGVHFSEPSQATQMVKMGRNIGTSLATGLQGQKGTLQAAMHGLSTSIAGPFSVTATTLARQQAAELMTAADKVKLHQEHVWHVLHMEHLQHLRDMGTTAAAAGGSYAGTTGGATMNVTVPLTLAFGAGTGGLEHDPQFLQYIQKTVQEAVLRYNVNNPGNGLAIATGGRL